jgi:hypothetical protein
VKILAIALSRSARGNRQRERGSWQNDNSGQPRGYPLLFKETRLKELQIEQLTAISRKLNRQRRSRGERITENTLIRVAIDLLLSRAEELSGTTEAELKKSVGLEFTE